MNSRNATICLVGTCMQCAEHACHVCSSEHGHDSSGWRMHDRCWHVAGHETKHFNVGQYRRKQNEQSNVQDASFFDHNNPVRHGSTDDADLTSVSLRLWLWAHMKSSAEAASGPVPLTGSI